LIDIFTTKNKYKIILADPPWQFKTYSDAGKDKSADNHYKIMNLEDIKKLPVKNLADKDAILFMWVTFPLLDKSFEVMNAWGFTYKTCGFNWIKANKSANLSKLDVNKDIRMNLGYYTRANSELCLLGDKNPDEPDLVLLGRKGKTLPRKSKAVRQVLISHQREHSRKPDEIYSKIENLFDGPYIELFARQEHINWDSWGNEVTKFNENN
jgi:N6-adenosine-specific RNA methylase IME4